MQNWNDLITHVSIKSSPELIVETSRSAVILPRFSTHSALVALPSAPTIVLAYFAHSVIELFLI